MGFLLKFTGWVFRNLPLPVVLATGRGLGWFLGSVVRHRRSDVLDALRRSFPEKTEAELLGISRRMYRMLGESALEYFYYTGRRVPELNERVVLRGAEHLDAALAQGRGAVILTAHFGSFDLMTVKAALSGYPISVLTKKIKNKAVDRAWRESRQVEGLTHLPSKISIRDCLRALKKNECVGFVLDQNMVRSEGVFVEFLGRPASTTPGLAYLAAAAGAPVVPAFCHSVGKGRHEVRIQPALGPPENRSDEAVRAATQRYVMVVEEAIREQPDHWIWIHRRWRTQPTKEELETDAWR